MESKEKLYRNMRISIIYSLVMMVLIMVAVTSSSYAWFTFNASTNVTPMSSTISKGDASLLIANTYNAEYKPSCELILNKDIRVFAPVSTADLKNFYSVKAQNSDGMALLYKTVEDPDSVLMHGTVYLKCVSGDCDVYFYKTELKVGGNSQILSAMRLGMKITNPNGVEHTYVFNLDSLATGAVDSKQTIPYSGMIVNSVNDDGTPVYANDSSVSISDYMTVNDMDDNGYITYNRGKEKLTTLSTGDIATVEYWFYLEGCDDNCTNEVKSSDALLQLAFAGVSVDEE